MQPEIGSGEQDVWSLLEVTASLGAGGLASYLQEVVERCTGWFSASGASLFISHDEPASRVGHAARYFCLAAASGSESRVPSGARFGLGEGIAGVALREGRPMLVDDPGAHPLLSAGVRRRREIGSAMIVPLVTTHEGPVGVLNLSRAAHARPFTSQDLHQAASLGRQIALAISNAQLLDRTARAMNEAKELHRVLQGVINAMHSGVVVFGHDDTPCLLNRPACQMFGLGEQALVPPKKLLRAVPTALRKATRVAVRMGLKRQATRVRVEDEQDRAWSIIGRPLADGVLVTFEDLTEYERQRGERERVNRLAEIGQMTAAIAHEIRNPLTGIRSAAQVIRSAPESCRELGAMIEEEATKLNDLCDSFLDFARPLSLVTRELRWSDIVSPVLEQHRAEIEAAQIQVRLKSEPDEPMITGDRVRLEQVFRNLLLNAVQATRPGGVVEVRCEGGKLIVQDNGVGMTEEDRQKLFTPFFTTKPSGTGLGLCNARKVVDAHGGSLSVTSSPDLGSCFVVDLSQRKCA